MITIDDLKHVALLQQLSPEDLEDILPHLHGRVFPAGTTVIYRGDPGGSLFVILNGSLDVTLINDEGVEYTVNTINMGDVFGEMALLTGEPRSANVKAVSEVALVELYQENFNQLVAKHPRLKMSLFRILAQRLGMNAGQVDATGGGIENISAILSRQQQPEVDQLLGKTKWTAEINAEIERLAESDSNVLILGERGTGKALAASLIHFKRKGKNCPLLHLDCADPPPVQREGVRENLHIAIAQESALFGHGVEVAGNARGGRNGYLELADNGILILENVEHLAPRAQRLLLSYLKEGNFQPQGEVRKISSRVRIIATAVSLEKTETSQTEEGFSSELAALLSVESLRMKPLRGRKKDISVIAEDQLKHFNQKYSRQVSAISSDAMSALVDHEWPLNVEELRQVMERAVAVCNGDTITQQQVFLNNHAFSTYGKINLLRIPKVRQILSHPLLPAALRYVTPPFILGLTLFTLLGPKVENPANLIVWGVWWPFLLFSIFIVARSWCGYCPMPVISDLITAGRKSSPAIPQSLSRHGGWIGIVGFVLIVVAEHSSNMFAQARPTAFLLLTILLGAITTNIFFGERSWCKYLCPLGSMVAHSSALSMLELGSNSNVCSTQCQTHDCVKDRNCPMSLHPSAATTSKDCVLCLSCVKSCHHHSVRINARFPWLEILNKEKAKMMDAVFAVVLIALVLAVKLSSFEPFRQFLHIGQEASFAVEALISLTIFLLFCILMSAAYYFPSAQDRKRSFSLAGNAWLFLGVAGFFNIYFHEFVYKVPNLINWTLAVMNLSGIVPLEWTTPNLGTLKALVPVVTLLGAATSLIMLKQIAERYALPLNVCRAHRALMLLTALILLLIL